MSDVAIAKVHHTGLSGAGTCLNCDEDWPCLTIRLACQVGELEAENARLRCKAICEHEGENLDCTLPDGHVYWDDNDALHAASNGSEW